MGIIAGHHGPGSDDFAQVFPRHVEAFSKLVISLRSEAGGELDLVLILAVIGEWHFAACVRPDGPKRATLGTTADPSIDAYSITQYTEIPPETVRREVTALVGQGWVACDARGTLSPMAKAVADLVRATDDALGLIDTLRTALRPERAGPWPPLRGASCALRRRSVRGAWRTAPRIGYAGGGNPRPMASSGRGGTTPRARGLRCRAVLSAERPDREGADARVRAAPDRRPPWVAALQDGPVATGASPWLTLPPSTPSATRIWARPAPRSR